MKKSILLTFILGICLNASHAADNYRWKIIPGQNNGIHWEIAGSKLPHYDDIEMSGLQVSTVVRYGVNEHGDFYLNRGMVWPLLRSIPNNTHASLMRHFGDDVMSTVLVNGWSLNDEKVTDISINGMLTVNSIFPNRLTLKRELFPSPTLPAFCERYTLTNNADRTYRVEIPSTVSTVQTRPEEGVYGSYKLVMKTNGVTRLLKKGESLFFSVTISGYKPTEKELDIDVDKELAQRKAFVREMSEKLILETPDSVLNAMFRFAKIRASESIYKTKGGFMHGPGGESFYAAIWANDQAEYVNPFFPFLGYTIGNESALNSYRHFARFMNKEYEPIPSSIIAEGDDIWNGAGDRGDGAMIAYGASRFALELSDKMAGQELWSLIEWCLEYCRRKLTSDGVVASDSDELEGRFPSGQANLCTSSLYYDALISASYLGKELGKTQSQLNSYLKQAKILRENINKYFGANVEGFDTYRYYDGNDKLRSWICIPLTMGITEKKEGTVKALLSPLLWTENGVLTQSGDDTFWDRTTLYTLRGILNVGETEKVISFLHSYSSTRLLGERVPYAVEAWPEGGKRHLSAESGLYCRVFTEGLFGIRPTGMKTFNLTPHLPKDWDKMQFRHIKAFGTDFDISVTRNKSKLNVIVSSGNNIILKKMILPGTTLEVKLK